MDKNDLKGNSYASQQGQTEGNSKAIVTNAVEKKPSQKTPRFFSEDAKSVGSYLLNDVAIPSLQKLLTDAVKGAIDWLVYGRKGSKPKPGIGTVSYSNYYTGSGYQQAGYSNPMITKQNNIYAVSDFVFQDRGDAENVLLAMIDSINKYGCVSVGDFYDFVNKAHTFTDLKYGWKDLSTAEIIRTSEGFSIRFPKVMPLE